MRPSPTRTTNPLHFGDLEPHRFEDLIRQLIYDFKDWQSIEATGRGGGDDGFDIRAYEKVSHITNNDGVEEEDSIGIHPMLGNVWMIQCKREKSIGPTRVREIISESIKDDNPQYGLILAAPVTFSKKSYDAFRTELREKGVMEFFLWGEAELEDFLYQPKNDRVLFTFFGVSLANKRRSKSSDVKFAINNKNKLIRILTDGEARKDFYKSILVRDIDDDNYPWREKCQNFENNPPWEEHIAFQLHPTGIAFHLRKYYAYVNEKAKEYDYISTNDLLIRSETERFVHFEDQTNDQSNKLRILSFWTHLPRAQQGYYLLDGLLKYNDILVIDEKGDIAFNIPHVFIASSPNIKSTFRTRTLLQIGDKGEYLDIEKFSRVNRFPKRIPDIKVGKVYRDKAIEWDSETLRLFSNHIDTVQDLFDVDGKYGFLNIDDVIPVSGAKAGGEDVFLKITYKYSTSVEEYLMDHRISLGKLQIERQLGRPVINAEVINVYEFERIYSWALRD